VAEDGGHDGLAYGSNSSNSADEEETIETNRGVGAKRKRGDESSSSDRCNFYWWSADEDLRLVQMKEVEKKSWADIMECFPERTLLACQVRYSTHLKKGVKKARKPGWSAEEDLLLVQLKETEKKSWADIAECFPGRSQVACKTRYHTHFTKGEKNERWSADDDLRIIHMKETEKKSFADIAKCFPERTRLACNVRYSNYLKKGEKHVQWSADDDLRIIHMKEI
jgi:hypothetical protein